MKIRPEKKLVSIGLTLFLTAVAIMLAYNLFFRIAEIKVLFGHLNKILAPVFYGLVLAYLMTPLLNLIEKKWIIRLFDYFKLMVSSKKRNTVIRAISVGLTIVIVLLLLFLFFKAVVPQTYESMKTLVSQYSTYSSNFINWVNELTKNNPEISKIIATLLSNYSAEAEDFFNDIAMPAVQKYLMPNVSGILESLSSGLVKAVSFVWNILVGLIISLYVIASKEKFASGSTRLCYAFLETEKANRFIRAMRYVHQTFIGFLSGKILDSAIIGFLCYLCCLFMKMPYPILISVIVGVTNIIPVFGPYIGAIPSTLIIMLVDPHKGLTFIIFIIILQQLDGNFIGPKILASSTGISSFWIIFAITLFGGLLGVFGMIIGVPVMAIIVNGVDRVTKGKLIKKELPVESDNYLSIERIDEYGTIKAYTPRPKQKSVNKDSLSYKVVNGIKKLFSKIGKAIFRFTKSIVVKIAKFFNEKRNNK